MSAERRSGEWSWWSKFGSGNVEDERGISKNNAEEVLHGPFDLPTDRLDRVAGSKDTEDLLGDHRYIGDLR